jgi:hypothetical protein
MRIPLLLLLLLCGPVAAHGQAQPAGPAASAPAPAQPLRAEIAPPAPNGELPRPQVVPARAELPALAAGVQVQPEKKPSRAVWFLVGVAVVLAIIVAVTL